MPKGRVPLHALGRQAEAEAWLNKWRLKSLRASFAGRPDAEEQAKSEYADWATRSFSDKVREYCQEVVWEIVPDAKVGRLPDDAQGDSRRARKEAAQLQETAGVLPTLAHCKELLDIGEPLGALRLARSLFQEVLGMRIAAAATEVLGERAHVVLVTGAKRGFSAS